MTTFGRPLFWCRVSPATNLHTVREGLLQSIDCQAELRPNSFDRTTRAICGLMHSIRDAIERPLP